MIKRFSTDLSVRSLRVAAVRVSDRLAELARENGSVNSAIVITIGIIALDPGGDRVKRTRSEASRAPCAAPSEASDA
jgi:hypothetical protein